MKVTVLTKLRASAFFAVSAGGAQGIQLRLGEQGSPACFWVPVVRALVRALVREEARETGLPHTDGVGKESECSAPLGKV